MANQLTDKDLCSALSDLFLDNEIDYAFIVRTACQFELRYVECVLLEWVAPVLSHTFFALVYEWAGYDLDWLWGEVQKVRAKNEKARWAGKMFLKVRRCLMAHFLRKKWACFLVEYHKQRAELGLG